MFCFRSTGKETRHLSPHPLRWPLCLVSLESQPCFSVWWISSSACEPLIALQAELGASLCTWVSDCPQSQLINALNVFFFEAPWVGLWVCLTILFLLRIPSVQCRALWCMFRWTGKLRRHHDRWLPFASAWHKQSLMHRIPVSVPAALWAQVQVHPDGFVSQGLLAHGHNFLCNISLDIALATLLQCEMYMLSSGSQLIFHWE